MSNIEWLRGWRHELAAAGRRPGTIAVRTSHIERMSVALGDPATITRDDLIGWLGGQGWAPATMRSVRASTRTFFAWAHETGRRADDPAATLPAVLQPRGLPRPAGEDTLMAAITSATPRVRLAVELMALCGLRRCEVAPVHSRDLLREVGGGWLLRVVGKGGHTRLVPCPAHLALEIERAGGWVFPGQIGGHLAPATVGKLVSAVLPVGVTPHALRHRFGTETYSRSHDIRATQELLGHASIATTQVYVQVADVQRRAVATAAWRIGA